MICMRTDLFQSHNSFIKKIEFGFKKVKRLKKAKGFKTIMHPGEPEYLNYLSNKKKGISLSKGIIIELNKLAQKYKVKTPFKI